MTWGLLHADPAPEAFRLDPDTGRCGVIDWSYALCGPLIPVRSFPAMRQAK